MDSSWINVLFAAPGVFISPSVAVVSDLQEFDSDIAPA